MVRSLIFLILICGVIWVLYDELVAGKYKPVTRIVKGLFNG